MNDAERDAQIRALLPLVRALARRVRRMVPGANHDDLIGDGNLGLVRAVDAFDPSFDVPLERYARHVILGAMLNGIRRLDPISERVRRTLRLAERARYALAHELGALPAQDAVERAVPGLARARIEAYRGAPLSLDAKLPIGERLAPDRRGDPQVIAAARARRDAVRRAIACLPDRQRAIIVAHYFEERPLRAIYGDLRVSPQRVSQLHLLALRRLRAALAESA